MFDQLRYANLPINLAFRTRTNYRLDFDDLYGVIQPRVKANFITKKEKQHVVNAMFIMIQNGISLAAKTNTVSKPILNPFSKYKKPVEKKPVSDFKKKDENVLMNEAGTSSRGFIFAPQFEKYLVYGVHKSNNLQILTFQEELPFERLNEWAKIHIRNNYKFLEHVLDTNSSQWVKNNDLPTLLIFLGIQRS